MVSPGSFLAFALVNAIVWPGLSVAYWYCYQRQEEGFMDEINSTTPSGDEPEPQMTSDRSSEVQD